MTWSEPLSNGPWGLTWRCLTWGRVLRRPVPRTHLQDEDEVVHWPVALVETVLHGPLVFMVVLQLLDDVGVFEEPQQDLLREAGRFEGFDF